MPEEAQFIDMHTTAAKGTRIRTSSSCSLLSPAFLRLPFAQIAQSSLVLKWALQGLRQRVVLQHRRHTTSGHTVHVYFNQWYACTRVSSSSTNSTRLRPIQCLRIAPKQIRLALINKLFKANCTGHVIEIELNIILSRIRILITNFYEKSFEEKKPWKYWQHS